MEHFDLSETLVNVKVLHNIYIKNIRFMAYEPETCIENFKKVLVLSEWLCGPEIMYKNSQIYYEMGKATTTLLNNNDKGRAFIEKGRTIQESLYGKGHPTLIRYISFISLQESVEDNKEEL